MLVMNEKTGKMMHKRMKRLPKETKGEEVIRLTQETVKNASVASIEMEKSRRESEVFEDMKWAYEHHSKGTQGVSAPSSGAASQLMFAREKFGEFMTKYTRMLEKRDEGRVTEEAIQKWTARQKKMMAAQLEKMKTKAEGE